MFFPSTISSPPRVTNVARSSALPPGALVNSTSEFSRGRSQRDQQMFQCGNARFAYTGDRFPPASSFAHIWRATLLRYSATQTSRRDGGAKTTSARRGRVVIIARRQTGGISLPALRGTLVEQKRRACCGIAINSRKARSRGAGDVFARFVLFVACSILS